MSISKRKRHTKFPKRSKKRLIAAAMITLSATAARAQDRWINPNGGNWSDVTNWSLGTIPVVQVQGFGGTYLKYYQAQFTQGAVSPYTVNVTRSLDLSDIFVQNDDVIINFNGSSYGEPSDSGDPLVVSCATGQTTNLTLQNGTISSDFPLLFPQTGGTCSLTLQSFTLFEGVDDPTQKNLPVNIGRTAGSVFNYTQIGGSLGTFGNAINIGNGIGMVNASITNGTVSTRDDHALSFNANVTLQNATLSTETENINFSGTVNVSGGSISPGGDFLVVGGIVPDYGPQQQPSPSAIPTTGGTNTSFNASNAILDLKQANLPCF